ncbi:MAG: tetratricopeptide repeat protein [Synechococcales cyanobacterium C42_A2020_086]|jgi:tetratricopeptide (TPR) repeat protein|nr:tetratricopeptide repeat protein [Synechococcales cyanobacterium C42_A2020_086]
MINPLRHYFPKLQRLLAIADAPIDSPALAADDAFSRPLAITTSTKPRSVKPARLSPEPNSADRLEPPRETESSLSAADASAAALDEVDLSQDGLAAPDCASPDAVSDLLADLLEGRRHLQRQNWAEAIASYRRVLQQDAHCAEAYQALAEALTQQGDWAEAAACYRQAIACAQLEAAAKYGAVVSVDSAAVGQANTEMNGVDSDRDDLLDDLDLDDLEMTDLEINTQSPNERCLPENDPEPELPKLDDSTLEKPEASSTGEKDISIPWFEQATFHLQQGVVHCNAGNWDAAIAACRQALTQLEPEAVTAYRTLGRALQGQQQWSAAEQAYRNALVIQPDSAETHARFASLCAEQQRWSEAVHHYQEAIRLQPRFAGAYWKLAELWQRLGNTESAADCWHAALQVEPNWATALEHLKLGNLLLKQNKPNPALDCYRRASDMDPTLAEAWFCAGTAHRQLGEATAALDCYQQAVVQAPENGAYWAALGQTLAELDRWQEALPCYRQLASLESYALEGLFGLRNAHTKLGQWQEALRYSQQLVRLQPESWQVHHGLGDIYSRLQQWPEAVAAYQQAIALNPEFSWSHNNLGDALIQLERWQEAAAAFAQAITLNPDFAWSHFNLGEVQAQLHRWDEAIAAYRRALELQPDLPHAIRKLGDALQQRAQADRATALTLYLQGIQTSPADVELYHRALELQPNHPGLCLHLANVLMQNNELDEAMVIYQLSLHLQAQQQNHGWQAGARQPISQPVADYVLPEPGGPSAQELTQLLVRQDAPGWEFYQTLGDKLQLHGRLSEAIDTYQKAIAADPTQARSHHSLGDAHLKLSHWQDAITAYQKAISLNPDYFWSHYNLGVAYGEAGQWQEAIAAYRHSQGLNPSLNLPIYAIKEALLKQWDSVFAEADLLLRHGNRKGASRLYRQAIAQYRQGLPLPQPLHPRPIPTSPNVLLIVDDHLPQCVHYRVQQKIEQLEHIGFPVQSFPLREIAAARNQLHFCHVVIFYRVPALPDVIETIEYAKAIQKVVFYEIDDLIFDEEAYPEPLDSYGGLVSEEQYLGLMRGTTLFREAMALCDYAIASTPCLAAAMEPVVAKRRSFVHRNALDQLHTNALHSAVKIERDYLSIFYGSGTKAHDADFNQLAAPAIARILEAYPQVRLTLVGYVTLSEVLLPYRDRIDRVDPIQDVEVYWEFLRQADINIAVLQPTRTTDCKSEIKWLEAACFHIPSVVSATQTYRELLRPGIDALFASTPDEWFTQLQALVLNPCLRQAIAQAAHTRVLQEYSVPVMAENLRQVIQAGIADATQVDTQTRILASSRCRKQKLLIVNVFYPPQSIGGGTRIVKDNVDVLLAEYGDIYDISVFTSDDNNPTPYQVQEYVYDGVPVTKVSTPTRAGMDWLYQDATLYELFTQYLQFHQPDLIHFHCVQRLTASVVEAAADQGIPYVVTLHDAWWISDHQFLVNASGEECADQQNDPLIIARDTQNLQDSMRRRRYLKQCLDRAGAVLAVSENFAEFYRRNGVPQTRTNRNGILPQPLFPRQPAQQRVRLAHVGGISAHKGFYLLKQAIEAAQLSNCELTVIDHALNVGSIRREKWGSTPVTYRAKVPQDKMPEFYSTIDVLIAPSTWRESFGLVTREAAAAKVWVVASNKGALAEDLLPGVNGDVFSADHPEELVQILQRIDRHPHIYQQPVSISVPIRTTQDQVNELVGFYQSIL